MGGARTFLTLGPGGMAVEVLPGQPGTARFTYALDEGPSRDAVAIPGERYDLGDGITLTFGAGTYVEGDTCSFLAGDPRAPRRGKKRPGQWTDRTRAKRARRLEKAQIRRQDERLCRLGGLNDDRRRGWHLCGPALTRFTEEAMRYHALPQ